MSDVLRRYLAPGGRLRASINLGNPVLAAGTPEAPRGVTPALARLVADRLDVEVDLLCVDAARHSLQSVADGRAELTFLAVDPDRAEVVAFTDPYVLIEGVYVVPADSEIATAEEVDRPGVRIGVKQGSAYDLFLTRELRSAEPVRGAEGVTVFDEESLEVGAGIRQPVGDYVSRRSDRRILEPAFMTIRQAMAVRAETPPAVLDWLQSLLDEARDSGLIARALQETGQDASLVAPAGSSAGPHRSGARRPRAAPLRSAHASETNLGRCRSRPARLLPRRMRRRLRGRLHGGRLQLVGQRHLRRRVVRGVHRRELRVQRVR